LKPAERIRATIDFKRVDRPPVAPELIGAAATLCGVLVRDYVRDGRLIAQCQAEAADMIGSDALFAAADLCVEAEALGCPVTFPEDNYPHVAAPIIHSISDLARLEVPDPLTAGRMPQILKAARLLAQDGGGRLVLGNAVGPITMASRIMDVEKMLYMIVDHPDQFRQVVAFCTAVSIRFVEAIAGAGAGGILLFDPSASPALLPPRIFREFALEPIREILAAAKRRNPSIVTWYSVAGPVQVNPAIMAAVAADVTTVDYPVPIQTAMDYSGSTVINGNIKPALFLEGTPDDIYREACSLLEAARLCGRFILGSGCEIPLYSPLANIQALRRAADGHVSRMTNANNPEEGSVRVAFLPHNRAVYVQPGETILAAAAKGGAPITTYCDLSGSCGECAVVVDSGDVTPPDKIEEVQLEGGAPGLRLSCLARTMGDTEVYIPFSSRRLPDKATAPPLLLDESAIVSAGAGLSPIFAPDPGEEAGDEAAVAGGPGCAQARGNGALPRPTYGLALDLSGENAIACVHDLASGELIHAGVFQGPVASMGLSAPASAGPEVIARLQEEIARLFNSIIGWLYECNSIMPERVRGVVAACCSAAGAALRENAAAQEGGWAEITCGRIAGSRLSDYPGLMVALMPEPPGPGAGASRDAAFIMSALEKYPVRQALFIHIGSSGSVTAVKDGGRPRHLPFAGGGILERPFPRRPLRLFGGLIHKASIGPDGETSFSTFGGAAPMGILGSAFIGLAAGMLRQGIIGPSGDFLPGPRPHLVGGKYVLVPKQKTAGYSPITVSHEDLEKIMRMGSACRAACAAAMGAAGLATGDVERVFVSGPFGAAADPADLAALGFFPEPLGGRAIFTLNAAGMGARMALLSRSAREKASAIAASMIPAAREGALP
jgi:uroporphyrinogen decarboxylase